MTGRRVFHVGITLAAMLGPFVTVAHASIGNGTVTTAPYRVAAPAIGMPLLAVLAVMLVGIGTYVLRRTRGRAVAMVALGAALTALAGLTYAIDGVIIEGADCGMVTVHQFSLIGVHTLTSACPNAIQILSIEFDCADPPGPSPCTEGQVLTQGQSCDLPECSM
jgi:hypothetical protein